MYCWEEDLSSQTCNVLICWQLDAQLAKFQILTHPIRSDRVVMACTAPASFKWSHMHIGQTGDRSISPGHFVLYELENKTPLIGCRC